MSSMNKENFNSNEKPVFIPNEFGNSYFDRKRNEWSNKNQQKKPLPANYKQFDSLNESEKEIVYEVIEQTKPPYEPFRKYIKLKDMVECLTDVWSFNE